MSTSTTQKSPIKAHAIPARSDPRDGSTHPPSPGVKKSSASEELQPAARWMRGQMVREFVRRMRRRNDGENSNSIRGRMRKRKAALALSAAAMGLSTAATKPVRPAPPILEYQADPTQERVSVDRLKVSETMKEALAEEEGVRLVVYRDVAGYPTVGVGHLVTPEDGLSVGDRITYDDAIEFLEQDLRKAEEGAKRLVRNLQLYQHEFDALVDLVYNVGEGNVSEDASPRLNEAIQTADYDRIAEELVYTTAGGEVARGLKYRSERRQSIFMEATYDDPRAIEVDIFGQARS
ncbi:lysozyme [Aurantiacibacter poecillastricola]|uniref:lysozyme n=1 Tax=Aurantiacibacter poecillastricola TaxID=3064385 RepID=UPI00273DFA64|nr:lysozyme [Aurantiacibacter sp. 219JJ12-13]MDP5261655.1 lysozyme [Aurantiacibacter sp. 219JJ12-13]